MAQQVKDVVLLQLWHRFSPWPGNFHMLQVQTKKKISFKHILILNMTTMYQHSARYCRY